MKKEEFLHRLKVSLKGLSKSEIKDILQDMEEHFALGIEKGKSEEEICKDLGEPEVIADSYKIDEVVGKEDKPLSVLKMILAGLALGFFNIIFILPTYLGFLGGYIGLTVASFGIVIAGFASVLVSIVPYMAAYVGISGINLLIVEGRLFLFFAGLAGISIGAFLFIILLLFTKIIYKFSLNYVKFNIRFIKKAGK